jgi:hypothetical protein
MRLGTKCQNELRSVRLELRAIDCIVIEPIISELQSEGAPMCSAQNFYPVWYCCKNLLLVFDIPVKEEEYVSEI